jgi:hypothetical protein
MTLALGTSPKLQSLFSAATLLAGTIAFSGALRGEETGHHQYHDSDYRHWKQPGTDVSCCSDQDCAPVRAELREGRWWALRRNEWYDVQDDQGRGQWLVLRNGEWIPVPDDKIIWVSNPTVEGAHLCYANGKVVCFVPPNTGG